MSKILTALACVFAASGFALDFASDVTPDIKKQIQADLAFVESIKGQQASALHKKIFGGVDGATYKKFFEKRVNYVGMDDCGNANAVACVIPPPFGIGSTSKIWLTENYVKFSHPQIARLMILFHESRHTEKKNSFWPHASCPDPFLDANGNDMVSLWTGAKLAGEPACDVTPFGSYGSSLILLKNVAKFCTSCAAKVKVDAGIYADDQVGRITGKDALAQIKADLYRK